MRDVLKRWLGGPAGGAPEAAASPAAALRRLLAAYPPNTLPHPGWGKRLTPEQAQANLAHFFAQRTARLDALAALLRTDGDIDIQPALDQPAALGAALADRLAAWAAPRWPALLDGRTVLADAWLTSPRSGADIALAMVGDIGLLFGELIRRANTAWRWDVDADPGRLKKDMASARRVVLLADPVGSHKATFVLDPEDVVALTFRRPDSVQASPGPVHPWRQLVEQGISGAPMAFWLNNP